MEWNDVPGDADVDLVVQAVPGFGGTAFDGFSAYDSGGALPITAPATVGLDAEHFVSSSTFALASGVVTVAETGLYALDWAVSVTGGGNARTQVACWVERNGVEVSGTRALLYARMASHGGSGGGSVFLSLDAGDSVRLRAQRTAGSGAVTSAANGSRLRIEKR